jgi:hypothetical protein
MFSNYLRILLRDSLFYDLKHLAGEFDRFSDIRATCVTPENDCRHNRQQIFFVSSFYLRWLVMLLIPFAAFLVVVAHVEIF